MAEEAGKGGKRDRSPAYPFIPLKTAIKRLAEFEKYFGRHPAPMDKVGLAWNMKATSSSAAQTMSALRYFGLLRYEGEDAGRVVTITDDGRNYLRAQQDQIKQEIAKRAALKPRAISQYWSKWGADRPPDPVAFDELILKGGFTDAAAKTFLQVYDETIAYANLKPADKPPEESGNQGGQADVGSGDPSDPPPPPPPPAPAVPAGVKMRQDTFTLDEGVVTIQWPDRLSRTSYDDLKDWLEIMGRKIERAISADEKKDQPAE